MPNKPKKKLFVIDNGSYDDKIIVSVGGTWEEVNRLYKKVYGLGRKWDMYMDKEDFDGDQAAFFDYDCNVLWLRDWKDNRYWNDVLRHECHHVCHYTLGIQRAMFKEPEALAYHQDYLVDTIRKLLNK